MIFSLNYRFPFDYRNIKGYLIAFTLEYIAFFFIVLIAICQTSFIPGSFWMLISLTQDVKNDLQLFNNFARSKNSHRSEILRKFYEVISFQSDANQLSSILSKLLKVGLNNSFNLLCIQRLAATFSEAYEFNFICFFSWSFFTICGALLMIQMEIVEYSFSENNFHVRKFISNSFRLIFWHLKHQSLNGIDPFLLVIPICEMFWSFALVFIFCEFGERVSTGYTEISDAINQFEWYLFPIGITRTLPIIMCYAQRPVVVKGIGNIACVRLMFKKVSGINSSVLFQIFVYALKMMSIHSHFLGR